METLDRDTILAGLAALNQKLKAVGVHGEICIYGGGVMVLAFNARLSTKDVDAVFQPADVIRKAAVEVSDGFGLKPDWLNDAVKGWLSPKGEHTSENLPQFSHLRLTRPKEQYLLAMKCLASRVSGFETQGDRADILFLAHALQLRSADAVLAIVEGYYPENLIQPKTRFFVEEIMSEIACDGPTSS